MLILSLLSALLCLGVGIGFATRQGRAAPSSDGAVCGGCGYSVRGVSELWCPECGADLREVGIEPPRASRSSKTLWIPLLIIALFFIGFILVSLLMWNESPSVGPAKRGPMPPNPVPQKSSSTYISPPIEVPAKDASEDE